MKKLMRDSCNWGCQSFLENFLNFSGRVTFTVVWSKIPHMLDVDVKLLEYLFTAVSWFVLYMCYHDQSAL